MSKLKELREKKGLSQSQLAKDTRINIRTLQAYEQGQRDLAGARIDTILRLCMYLECDLQTLFEDDPYLLELLGLYLYTKHIKNK